MTKLIITATIISDDAEIGTLVAPTIDFNPMPNGHGKIHRLHELELRANGNKPSSSFKLRKGVGIMERPIRKGHKSLIQQTQTFCISGDILKKFGGISPASIGAQIVFNNEAAFNQK